MASMTSILCPLKKITSGTASTMSAVVANVGSTRLESFTVCIKSSLSVMSVKSADWGSRLVSSCYDSVLGHMMLNLCVSWTSSRGGRCSAGLAWRGDHRKSPHDGGSHARLCNLSAWKISTEAEEGGSRVLRKCRASSRVGGSACRRSCKVSSQSSVSKASALNLLSTGRLSEGYMHLELKKQGNRDVCGSRSPKRW